MKYVYYENGTGNITQISPVREEASIHPYIEVEDDEVEEMFNGNVSTLRYYVKPLSTIKPIGKIVKKEKASLNWSSINDWLYLVPNDDELPDCLITQNITNKTIKIELTKITVKEWWKANSFFQRPEFPLTVCFSKDPHDSLWTKWINSKDIVDGFEFSYIGPDDIYFFTHKFFDSYKHERIT